MPRKGIPQAVLCAEPVKFLPALRFLFLCLLESFRSLRDARIGSIMSVRQGSALEKGTVGHHIFH